MGRFLYFAYGSNMCTGRLKDKKRCPSCKPLCIAKLTGYKLLFHKLSNKDCSGKADAYKTGIDDDVVWGVIFSIDDNEEQKLDNSEGLGYGYNKTIVDVIDIDGNTHQVKIYVADKKAINSKLRPYAWYKRFVVEGAKQHQLPKDYINQINQFVTVEDPDIGRDADNRKIQC